MIGQLAFPFDQRWQDRAEVRRTPGDRINPRCYGVDVIPSRVAKPFVCQHHYSGSYPADHVAVGLYAKHGVARSYLAGVAVFSEGVQSGKAMPRWTGFDAAAGTEIGRLVLLPEVPHNGESWFIARAFAALRAAKPQVRVALSYSDPVERTTAAGQVVKPGHFGTIYQASNALFLGRATARSLLLLPDGRVLHPYLFDKLRHRRQGWAYALRAVEQAGAVAGVEARRWGEDEATWLGRVRGALRPLRHPGNLTYAFGLDREAWASLRTKHGGGLPYPKACIMEAA